MLPLAATTKKAGGYLDLRLLRPRSTQNNPLDHIPRLTVIH